MEWKNATFQWKWLETDTTPGSEIIKSLLPIRGARVGDVVTFKHQFFQPDGNFLSELSTNCIVSSFWRLPFTILRHPLPSFPKDAAFCVTKMASVECEFPDGFGSDKKTIEWDLTKSKRDFIYPKVGEELHGRIGPLCDEKLNSWSQVLLLLERTYGKRFDSIVEDFNSARRMVGTIAGNGPVGFEGVNDMFHEHRHAMLQKEEFGSTYIEDYMKYLCSDSMEDSCKSWIVACDETETVALFAVFRVGVNAIACANFDRDARFFSAYGFRRVEIVWGPVYETVKAIVICLALGRRKLSFSRYRVQSVGTSSIDPGDDRLPKASLSFPISHESTQSGASSQSDVSSSTGDSLHGRRDEQDGGGFSIELEQRDPSHVPSPKPAKDVQKGWAEEEKLTSEPEFVRQEATTLRRSFEFDLPVMAEEALNYAFPLVPKAFLSMGDPLSMCEATLKKRCGLVSMLGLGNTLRPATATDYISRSPSWLVLDHNQKEQFLIARAVWGSDDPSTKLHLHVDVMEPGSECTMQLKKFVEKIDVDELIVLEYLKH
eukprot:TRINITY_DN1127_c0_g1_i1.p1 TRINITY_DN1127_c0_g1~~TRINITY_DN1127_c0_g1_i1.p1  ORF type:complete len:544 (-),score=128.34 TRINITY_DN1127_c0_g1_i1:78-1709(-)